MSAGRDEIIELRKSVRPHAEDRVVGKYGKPKIRGKSKVWMLSDWQIFDYLEREP